MNSAWSREVAHILGSGFKFLQTSGLSFFPNNRQRNCLSRWMHGIPASLPFGIPGMKEDIEGAIQQAPHFSRQSI